MGSDIPIIETELYGRLRAPNTLGQLSSLLENVTYTYGDPGFWRGQADVKWRVDSTAIRRIRTDLYVNHAGPSRIGELALALSTEGLVRRYETKLLYQARAKGFGFRTGRKLSDLELLACLQHYGAATRLIDFTKNAFIALWFACASNPKEYGLLLGTDIKSDTARYLHVQDVELPDLPLDQLFRKHPGKTFIWESVHMFDRMRVQQSVFLFGESRNGDWGCITDDGFLDDNGYFAFAISPTLKEEMQSNCQILFGYDLSTLFPDIEGFGRAHSSISEFEWDFFSNES